MTTVLALPALAVLFGIVVVLALGARATADSPDVVWLAGVPVPAPDEAAVTVRYLRRHRGHRVVGGALGVFLALVIAVRWTSQVRVGVGGTTPLADPLFLGLAGVIVGALLAESFRLPRPRGPVAASLQPRDTSTGAGHRRAARLLIGTASLLVVLQLAVGGDDVATARGLTALVVGAAIVALAELTRRRIVDRRRPLLSDRATRLDGRFRAFATASCARLEFAAAALTAAWAASAVRLPGSPPGWAVDVLGLVQVVAVLAGLVVAIVQLRRARPRPPRHWAPGAPSGIPGAPA